MKVSYYPGCSLDGSAREYDESLKAVAGTLDIELEELPGWTCCGSSSAHVTDEGLAVDLALRNLVIANATGRDLLVPCAACYQRLKNAEKTLTPENALERGSGETHPPVRIKHSADFIWEICGEKTIAGKLKKPLGGLNPVCYYGCLTTRPPRVTDARDPEDPKAMDGILMSLAANIKGWSYKTDCCGGSLMLTHPDLAQTMVRRLLDGALEAGADCIVVGCPMCHSNLDLRQKEIRQINGGGYHIPIYYFTELMGLAFGDRSVKKWIRRHLTDAATLLERQKLL
jgi:heterodisulfide reductase subunit B2